MKSHCVHSHQGFTLIEMLIIIFIIIITLHSTAAISRSTLQNWKIKTHTQTLYEAITFTRHMAIKSNQRSTLLAKEGFSKGWIIFIDRNNNGQRDSDEPVIAEQRTLNGISIRANDTSITNYISFIGTGQSTKHNQKNNGGMLAGTIYVCSEKSSINGTALILAKSGRTRVTTGVRCP